MSRTAGLHSLEQMISNQKKLIQPTVPDGSVVSLSACILLWIAELLRMWGRAGKDFFCYVEDAGLGFHLALTAMKPCTCHML